MKPGEEKQQPARSRRRRRRGRRGRSATGGGGGPRTGVPADTDQAETGSPVTGPAETGPAGTGPAEISAAVHPASRGAGPARDRGPARRKQRAELPPPRQIRGRRRTRSGRIEEVSSGGLVVDDFGGEIRGVLIGKHDRRGRLVWSLPKGHVELGETLEETAVREIEEETGVRSEVQHELGEVDYWFMLHGEKIHKTVHHFLLRFLSGELCDRDREVVEVAWVPLDEIHDRLAHPDERRLVAQVPALLARRSA